MGSAGLGRKPVMDSHSGSYEATEVDKAPAAFSTLCLSLRFLRKLTKDSKNQSDPLGCCPPKALRLFYASRMVSEEQFRKLLWN